MKAELPDLNARERGGTQKVIYAAFSQRAKRCSRSAQMTQASALIQPVLLGISLLLMHYRAAAAVKFDGWVVYEAGLTGPYRASTREGFSVICEKDKWLITTVLIETKPPLSTWDRVWPAEQQVGTDGHDLYYLKTLIKTPTNDMQVGVVEPGRVPNMAQSPSVPLLWFAFASHELLASQHRDQLEQIWPRDERKDRHVPCLVKVNYSFLPERPGFLRELAYLSDGRRDTCNPRRELGNLAPEPWSAGYTQGVYRAANVSLFQDVSYPREFAFELFAAYLSNQVGHLGVCARTYAAVTNVAALSYSAGWLPTLPKTFVTVEDYRFQAAVTNWDTVAYRVSNSWPSRSDPKVAASVAMHVNTTPIKRYRRQPELNGGRIVIICAMVLPLAVALIRYTMKERLDNKRNP